MTGDQQGTGVRFERPVIILSAPRSGSTLLYQVLGNAPGLYTIGNESHRIIEGMAGFHPRQRDHASNRLVEADATDKVVADIRSYFADGLRDRRGQPPAPGEPVRFLEKTPKNILRVPFLRKVFPDAVFVVLFRDPRAVLSSMMEAWRSGMFVTYPGLPGWQGLPWSLLLVEGWRHAIGKPLEAVVAHQWASGMSTLLDDLGNLPAGAWIPLRYEALVQQPQSCLEGLCGALGLDWDLSIGSLPLSRVTVSPPAPNKWLRDAEAIGRVLPVVAPVQERVERVLAARG